MKPFSHCPTPVTEGLEGAGRSRRHCLAQKDSLVDVVGTKKLMVPGPVSRQTRVEINDDNHDTNNIIFLLFYSWSTSYE